jgi:hypothetical protein
VEGLSLNLRLLLLLEHVNLLQDLVRGHNFTDHLFMEEFSVCEIDFFTHADSAALLEFSLNFEDTFSPLPRLLLLLLLPFLHL